MKFPRWLIVSMLTASALAALGAGAWWWVTWPEQSATQFVAFLASDQLGNAKPMVVPLEFERDSWPHRGYEEWRLRPTEPFVLTQALCFTPEWRWQRFGKSHAMMSPRGVMDIIIGRQRFTIVPGDGDTLIARRGEVLEQ